jgi:hypothetical protein
MSSLNFNKPPEEDKNGSKSDAKKKPSFETKRVVHLSKQLSPSGEASPRPASLPEARNQPGVPPTPQPKTNSERGKAEGFPTRADQAVSPRTSKITNPGLRLRALVTAGKKPPASKPQGISRLFIGRDLTPRSFWDVATVCSLVFNIILMAILVIMAFQIRNLKTTTSGLLHGLYGNFVEMDRSSITTTITVDKQVPIDFMLPIQQNTDVTLTQSVIIPNAHIVINSGGFTINSAASITLPAGTNLPVALNMTVPVQFIVPVTLQVPVNIPLAQTDLHQPLTGLQDSIRAYFCNFDRNAQYPQGVYICDDHGVSTAIPSIP